MTREEFRKMIENGPVILDGATGSNLRAAGLPVGVCTEAWVLEHPEILMDLQRAYADAGSNIVYAPTFGGNRLNLEMYGGIGGHFEKGGQTLEDILYYARQEKGNLGFMLTKAVRHRGNLDYVLPIPVSEDMKQIEAEEWIRLFQQILSQSIYETIILDIDEGIRDVYELLELCNEIHLLEDESEYSAAKIQQFERELHILGHESLLSKIVRKGDLKWSKQNGFMNGF